MAEIAAIRRRYVHSSEELMLNFTRESDCHPSPIYTGPDSVHLHPVSAQHKQGWLAISC